MGADVAHYFKVLLEIAQDDDEDARTPWCGQPGRTFQR